MPTTFRVWPLRFHFRALDPVLFPEGKAANILRGAFGITFRRIACVPDCNDARHCEIAAQCPYALVFEPRHEWAAAGIAPSGFADWPRPFVFRALHLDGQRLSPSQSFHFDVVLFDQPAVTLPYFLLAFRELADSGLGPTRGRAMLTSVDSLSERRQVYDGRRLAANPPAPVVFEFPAAVVGAVNRVTLRFTTPTELKSAGEVAVLPEFGILFRRLRDRISNLRAFYQGGPLEIDFDELGEIADRVRLTGHELHQQSVERLSSRTGQRHPLGGFAGDVVYEGELTPFLPFLRAGEWTGVGRQTVWGKGCFTVVGGCRNHKAG